MAVERTLMTAEELLRLPEDGMRHELIDGELRTMPPPGGEHGTGGGRAWGRLFRHIENHGLGECLLAETGFLIKRAPDTVRAPDFAFIRADRVPAGGMPRGYIPFAPDMVLEVVSLGDTAAEVRAKVDEWLAFGCRAVWVLYPGPRLDVHLADGTMRRHGSDDQIAGGDALPGFLMRLDALVRPVGRQPDARL